MSNHVHTVVRRSVPCYFCNEFLDEKLLSEHVMHCAAVLNECPNKCGVYVPRSNLEEHKKKCGKKMSKKNSQIKEIQDSVWKEKVFAVLTLLRLAIDHGEKDRTHLQNTLSRNLSLLHTQQESLSTLQLCVMETADEVRINNAIINQRLNDLEIVTDDMQHRVSVSFQQISEQLKLFEENFFGQKSKRECVPNDRIKELRDLKTFVAKEGIRVSDMWQEQTQHINDLKLELEMRCKSTKELISKYDILSEKVDDLFKEIRKHTENIAEQKSDTKGLKFQMKENLKYVEELIAENSRTDSSCLSSCSYIAERIECASTNGRIIWRIDRYKEKMNEAKDSNRPLYSPMFFNKKYGYTLRLELFLNGRGQWKDRHIIGCLRVENGKWDPLLDWPCILRANVILRDQDNPANNIRKMVKAVSRDKHDTDESDKEFGLYMFISHSTLSRYSSYTKNNVMFFDVQVIDIKTSASMSSLTTTDSAIL